MAQAPNTLGPTFPITQLNHIFHQIHSKFVTPGSLLQICSRRAQTNLHSQEDFIYYTRCFHQLLSGLYLSIGLIWTKVTGSFMATDFTPKNIRVQEAFPLCLCLSGSAISRPIPAADGAAAWWRGRRARGCDARHEGSWRRRSNNSVPLQLHDTFIVSSYEDVLSIHIQLTTRFHNKVKEMLNKRNKSVVKLVEIRLRLSASPVLPRYLLSALMFVQPDSTHKLSSSATVTCLTSPLKHEGNSQAKLLSLFVVFDSKFLLYHPKPAPL